MTKLIVMQTLIPAMCCSHILFVEMRLADTDILSI